MEIIVPTPIDVVLSSETGQFASVTSLITSGALLYSWIVVGSGAGGGGISAAELAATGAKITALSGYVNNISGYLDNRFSLTGSNLYNTITGFSGQANINFATIINLATTGSNLYAIITGLSGANSNTYATLLQLTSTGANLQSQINALSGAAYLTTGNADLRYVHLVGNETISGVKTFRGPIYVATFGGDGLAININGISGSYAGMSGAGNEVDILDGQLKIVPSNTTLDWKALVLSGEWLTNAVGTNNFTIVNFQRLTSVSGALVSQISAAAAGVSTLNGLSGVVNLKGTGGLTLTTNGQNIIISGAASGAVGVTTGTTNGLYLLKVANIIPEQDVQSDVLFAGITRFVVGRFPSGANAIFTDTDPPVGDYELNIDSRSFGFEFDGTGGDSLVNGIDFGIGTIWVTNFTTGTKLDFNNQTLSGEWTFNSQGNDPYKLINYIRLSGASGQLQGQINNLVQTGSTLYVLITGQSGNYTNLNLPISKSKIIGVINKNGSSWLHDFSGLNSGSNPLGRNIFLGSGAGNFSLFASGSTSEGSDNIGIGYQTLQSLKNGFGNISIGKSAGKSSESTVSNVLIGSAAGQNLKDGSYVVAIGDGALGASISGRWDIAIGQQALFRHSGQSNNDNNIAIGAQCAQSLRYGFWNIAMGDASLNNTIGGDQNISIGPLGLSNDSKAKTGNIVIGGFAGSNETGSRYFYLHNWLLDNGGGGGTIEDDRNLSLMWGTFTDDPATQTLNINGTVYVSGSLFANNLATISNLTQTGSNLYILATGISGALQSQITAGGSSVKVTGSANIATANFTGIGGTVVLYSGSQVFISGGSSSNSSAGTKTLAFFTPLDNQPPASNYAIPDTRNSISVLNFEDTVNTSATFNGVIPEAANLSAGLKARIDWVAGTTTGATVWGVKFMRLGGSNNIDTDTYGLAAEVTTTTNGTVGNFNLTEITVTGLNNIVTGDSYRLNLYRNAASVSDTLTGYSQFLTVELRTAN